MTAAPPIGAAPQIGLQALHGLGCCAKHLKTMSKKLTRPRMRLLLQSGLQRRFWIVRLTLNPNRRDPQPLFGNVWPKGMMALHVHRP
jgi:hypothetical protein